MLLCGVLGGFELIIVVAISLLAFLIPIVAIVDIVKGEFKGNNKLVWILVVFFFSFIGAILYFLIGKDQKIKQ